MAAQRIIDGAVGLPELIGEELEVSDWRSIDQSVIDGFGRITGDEQWIRMAPVRAAEGPFGTTTAHGFLLLSLFPVLASQVYDVKGIAARVNYGLEKVRFPQPLHVDEKVRDRVSISGVSAPQRAHASLFRTNSNRTEPTGRSVSNKPSSSSPGASSHPSAEQRKEGLSAWTPKILKRFSTRCATLFAPG